MDSFLIQTSLLELINVYPKALNQRNGKTTASKHMTRLSNVANEGLVPPTEINRWESLLTFLMSMGFPMSAHKRSKAKRGDLLFKHQRARHLLHV